MNVKKIMPYAIALLAFLIVWNFEFNNLTYHLFNFFNVFYSISFILSLLFIVAPGSLLSSIATFIVSPIFAGFYYYTLTNEKNKITRTFYYLFITASLVLAGILIFTGAQMISNPPPNAGGIGINPGGFDQFLAVTGLILFNTFLIKKWRGIKWITFGKTFLNYFLFLFEVIISISVSIIVYNLGLMNNATPMDLLLRILSMVFIGLFAFFFLQEARNKLKV